MKKVLYVFAVMAMTVALGPLAIADAVTFNHYDSTYVLSSENAADNGNVVIDNAFISDPSSTKSLVITGFEYLFGGTGYSASMGLPSGGGSGDTYGLGEGAFSNSTGTGWSKNLTPTAGGAVDPTGNQKDYLSSVTVLLGNSGDPGFCYIGEVLTPGGTCDVELEVTANYGGAQGSQSTTHIWGYAEGNEGTGTLNTSTDDWQHGNTAVDQAMVESIEIDVTPEPRSLVLLGTGFGVLGLVMFLRRKHTVSHPKAI